MTRAVLFDIDGTLIRTGGAGTKAFARTAEIFYERPGGTRHMSFHGRTDTSLVREFLTLHSIPATPDEIERFLACYLHVLRDELDRFSGEICPGVRELIGALRELPDPPLIGLLTGNVRIGAALKLSAHGLEESFLLGAFGDDHEKRNELAVIARIRVGEMLGREIDGSEIVVIGDTRADIECAHYIGARCVAVATGGQTLPELLEHSPALALDSLSEISAQGIVSAGARVERPTDWEGLYQAKDTRWDKGEPSPGLVDFLRDRGDLLKRGQSVAVPGCGRGHDARAWAARGLRTFGFDLSPTAILEAAAAAQGVAGVSFHVADFLSDDPPRRFDWVFEHTLFCAISPRLRKDYIPAVSRWLRKGGHFFAIHYLQPEDDAGPPFGVTVKEVLDGFGPEFELLDQWVPRSFKGRVGRERCFLWRKR